MRDVYSAAARPLLGARRRVCCIAQNVANCECDRVWVVRARAKGSRTGGRFPRLGPERDTRKSRRSDSRRLGCEARRCGAIRREGKGCWERLAEDATWGLMRTRVGAGELRVWGAKYEVHKRRRGSDLPPSRCTMYSVQASFLHREGQSQRGTETWVDHLTALNRGWKGTMCPRGSASMRRTPSPPP